MGTARDGLEILELIKVLQSGDLEMNEYTMINVLSAIASLRLLISGRQVQELGQKVGFLKVICVSNALMSMYGKCGGMYDARHVFDDMLHRVSVSWNSLTAGYSENGFSSQALEVFSQMRDISLQPNEYALASVLEVVSNLNSVIQAMQIHLHMIKCGFMFNDSMLSCLIIKYGKCHGIDEAKEILPC